MPKLNNRIPKYCLHKASGQGIVTLFFGTRHGLFWLLPQSPGIGKGSGPYAPKADFWSRPAPGDRPPDLGAFTFEPCLLQAEARATWYLNWAYGYQPREIADMPDLWIFPR